MLAVASADAYVGLQNKKGHSDPSVHTADSRSHAGFPWNTNRPRSMYYRVSGFSFQNCECNFDFAREI